MEEELARPTEKVVNMSVAPGKLSWYDAGGGANRTDGSRVEAKTPEGTHIATPSQAAASGSQPMPTTSGAGTPRTASYAGAVKTAPVDWHLQFSLNGKAVSLEDTIYGAVHKSAAASSGANVPNTVGGVYGAPVILKFKKVDGPAPTSKLSLL